MKKIFLILATIPYLIFSQDVTETTISTIAQNVGEDCTDVLSLNENTISGGCVGLLRKQ